MTHVNKMLAAVAAWAATAVVLCATAAVVGAAVVGAGYVLTGRASWSAFWLVVVGDLVRQLLDQWLRRRRDGQREQSSPTG